MCEDWGNGRKFKSIQVMFLVSKENGRAKTLANLILQESSQRDRQSKRLLQALEP